MPELPEVQITVNALAGSGILGVAITRAMVFWPRTIATPSVDAFCRLLAGARIESIDRRGKLLLFQMRENLTLAVHLRMTGRFQVVDRNEERSAHVHVVIEFENGQRLLFHDTRKFGRFYLVQDAGTVTRNLGVEPLSRAFSLACLTRLVRSRNRIIKPMLLDQTMIAGLGNIYVDEALWMAGIHPLRRSGGLDPSEIAGLRRAIRFVLKQAIKNHGTTLGHGKNNFSAPGGLSGHNEQHLKVFRRSRRPCPRCGHPVERIIVAQRSSHVCPHCQPLH
jgi:formamidopyrimidine-DNA glycosylase